MSHRVAVATPNESGPYKAVPLALIVTWFPSARSIPVSNPDAVLFLLAGIAALVPFRLPLS